MTTKKYRVLLCTKGVHSWYELEVWEPSWFCFGKFKWKTVKISHPDAGTTAITFLTKQEAIRYADQRYAPEQRMVLEESK
jgi:hypothetical protein